MDRALHAGVRLACVILTKFKHEKQLCRGAEEVLEQAARNNSVAYSKLYDACKALREAKAAFRDILQTHFSAKAEEDLSILVCADDMRAVVAYEDAKSRVDMCTREFMTCAEYFIQ